MINRLKRLFHKECYYLERSTDDGSVTFRGTFKTQEEVQNMIMVQALALRNNLMRIGYKDSDFDMKDQDGFVVLSWNHGKDFVRWKTTYNVYRLFNSK